jgi:outer membrane protein OmpA-like peptidoglycan-associated protein
MVTRGGSGDGAVTFRAVNGSAKGCKIIAGRLRATRAGTCVVTATKAGDATFVEATSLATRVFMRKPLHQKPTSIMVRFNYYSSSLSGAAKIILARLARRLNIGASVTIVGYSLGLRNLARNRARAVVGFLRSRVKIHGRIVVVTSIALRAVKVFVTRW